MKSNIAEPEGEAAKPSKSAARPEVKIEVKQVKHTFTESERNQIGGDLARAIAGLRGVQAEEEQIRASYKAKKTEGEAKIDSLSTSLMNGFDFRMERCRVEFKPSERRKLFFLESALANSEPVLVEEMTRDDFQADLIQAESKFEMREEIELFPPAGNSTGIMAVGRYNDKWYAALRVEIGQRKISERLDSEQPCCKHRRDAIKKCGKRLNEWLLESLGKESAKGFEEPIAKALAPHAEREE